MSSVQDLLALEELLKKLSSEQLEKLQNMPGIKENLGRWKPNPGPQSIAYHCAADELFYGGQAGGGKTDLILGLSLTAHSRSLILRRTNSEANELVDRYEEVIGNRDGWNGQKNKWRLDGKIIDIGGCQHEDDKQKYKGIPHDLIGFDEISDFTQSQYRFIIGWNRTTEKGQRTRVVGAGNPPTTPEGLWVIQHWAPWLDENHPDYPAPPGELRWYTTIGGKDVEVDGPGPHKIKGEEVYAKSRTFIPSTLDDNPDLSETNYGANLAALPEELRVAYKEGRFTNAIRDDNAQVIKTSWIMAAQERWHTEGWKEYEMTAMAIDPAGGGRDKESLVWRHGGWYAEPIITSGEETASGSRAAANVVAHRRNMAPVIVDVGGGYGGAIVQRLQDNNIEHHYFNGAHASSAYTKDGSTRFYNKRAEAWWRMREALDPDQEGGSPIALPPGADIRADLAAPRFTMTQRGIKLESKDEIRKRLGRSPDKGDSLVMCLSEGEAIITRQMKRTTARKPRVVLGHSKVKRRRR